MHARVKPSAAFQWLHCPASVKLSERAGDIESEYSKQGRLAHKIAECLLTDEDVTPLRADELYTPDLEDYAREYADYVKSLIGPHSDISIEELFLISDDLYGTPDAVIFSPGHIDVVDLKSGEGHKVTDFSQLKVYAAAAIQEYSPRRYGGVELTTVTLHIIQPALYNREVSEFSAKEITKWLNKTVMPAVDEALNSPGFSVPGPWCKFCAGRAYCYENGEKYRRFDTSTPLSELKVDDMAEILNQLEGVIGYRDQIKRALTTELENGAYVPGYELAPGRSKRVWDNSDALTRKMKEMGLTSFLTPAQVQKKVGKKEFENTFAEFVEIQDGKNTIKRAEK